MDFDDEYFERMEEFEEKIWNAFKGLDFKK